MENYVITSDWHLGDEVVFHKERAGFGMFGSSIAGHDLYIAQKVAIKLSEMDESDTFYFLGDFGFPHDKIWDILKKGFEKAACKTVCVLGNHDKEKERALLSELFDEVHENPIFISKRCVLSHYPYPQQENVLNVSGHLHGSTLDLSNYICASIAVANCNFISKSQVENAISRLPKWDMRFLYEPWAEHYVFTRRNKDVIKDKNGRIDLAASRVWQKLQREKEKSQGKFE